MAAPAMTDPDLIVEFRKLMEERYALEKKATAEQIAKGEIHGETKERIEKLEAAIADHVKKFEALSNSFRESRSRPPVALGASGELAEFRSVGMQFTEHESYKTNAATARPRVQVAIKGRLIQPLELRSAGVNPTVINPFISSAGAGWVFLPKRVGVFTQPIFPLVMRDFLDVVPLDGTNAIDYMIETF